MDPEFKNKYMSEPLPGTEAPPTDLPVVIKEALDNVNRWLNLHRFFYAPMTNTNTRLHEQVPVILLSASARTSRFTNDNRIIATIESINLTDPDLYVRMNEADPLTVDAAASLIIGLRLSIPCMPGIMIPLYKAELELKRDSMEADVRKRLEALGLINSTSSGPECQTTGDG